MRHAPARATKSAMSWVRRAWANLVPCLRESARGDKSARHAGLLRFDELGHFFDACFGQLDAAARDGERRHGAAEIDEPLIVAIGVAKRLPCALRLPESRG